MEELLKEAMVAGGPLHPSTPYKTPKKVDVPPLDRSHQALEIFPTTDDGKPILNNYGGVGMVVDETLADPITARGDCMSLVSHCIQSPKQPGARTLDECFASVPVCDSNQPWADPEPCCAQACVDVYRTLRERNFGAPEAFTRTIGTHCFPGLREFMAAK